MTATIRSYGGEGTLTSVPRPAMEGRYAGFEDERSEKRTWVSMAPPARG